jgi:kynurenine formamidase
VTLAPRQSHGWDLSVALPAAAGRVYDLAQPLATGMPHHPNHPPYAFTLTKRHGEVMMADGVSASAEQITTGGHVGTHIDGLCHISKDGRVHGGALVADAQSYGGGISVNPVHELPPILGPGHLVDLPRLLGRDATPEDGVGADELARWFEERPEPEPGSVVLVRTGWARNWGDNRTYLGTDTGCPGVTLSGARWLTERGILATGADTIAYDQTPAPGVPVHVHLLVESGVPIMEALDLEQLAADEVWSFFFIAIPLAIHNGTGSPIRPLALAPPDGSAASGAA